MLERIQQELSLMTASMKGNEGGNEEDKGQLRRLNLLKSRSEVLMAAVMDPFRQGAQGHAKDLQLLITPSGFELEYIPFNKVLLLNGTESKRTSICNAREMAERLPHAELFAIPRPHLTDHDWRLYEFVLNVIAMVNEIYPRFSSNDKDVPIPNFQPQA